MKSPFQTLAIGTARIATKIFQIENKKKQKQNKRKTRTKTNSIHELKFASNIITILTSKKSNDFSKLFLLPLFGGKNPIFD